MANCKATVYLGKENICKNCIKADVCKVVEEFKKEPVDGMYIEGCEYFKDRTQFLELPYTPIPLICDEDKSSSDVQCPCCGTDLSGHYTDGDEEPLSIIQCYNCGMICDNTKVITKKAAEKTLEEREKDDNK